MSVMHTPKKGGKENQEENKEQSGSESEHNESEEDLEEDEEEEDPLSLLIYKRGQVKAKVTRVRNAIRTDRAMNLPRVQVLQRSLLTFYDEYTRYHNEILDSVNKKGRKAQETKYVEFEDLYTSTLVAVQALEIELATQIPSPLPSTSSAGTERIVIRQQALKAPLPTFDGRYENWARFKSMFLDLMKYSHDSDAIKLYHLEKCLVGTAAGVIDIKTINDNNYARAWQILEDRFENKRNIIDTHIRGLSNLKKMTKESYTELRELIEECTRHVDHLEFMEQRLEGVSELMVINHLSDALDTETKKLWEATLEYGQLPTYKETIDFLKKRCQILERCQPSASSSAPAAQQKSKPTAKSTPQASKSVTKVHAAAAQLSSDSFSCPLCNKTHPTFRCDEFRALSIEERNKRAKDQNVCFNCLRKGHRLADCNSKKNCMVCKARHNTLLHSDSSNKNSKEKPCQPKTETTPSDMTSQNQQPVVPAAAPNKSSESVSCSCMPHTPNQVLLMTAVVHVFDANQKAHPCRAFLDPGSMSHMVSKKFAKQLGLPTTPTLATVSGISAMQLTAHKVVSLTFQSRTSDYQKLISCLVLDRITGSLPMADINTERWRIPPDFELADPQFNTSDEIDLLIGCGLFWKLLLPGSLSIGDNLPELHNTKLGWIVSGEYSTSLDSSEAVVVHSNAAVVSSLETLVQRFWELEEVAESSPYTSEEEFCEQHFQQTHSRDESGRYIVSLPFNDTLNELGDTRAVAIKRFIMLEKRLSRCNDLKQQYVAFMNEYQQLQHCKEIDESKDPPADLTKMYRQVRVTDADSRFQRVFWREDPKDPLKVFELSTVTYGTASAPFLATRALKQLAIDEQERFPEASRVVEHYFYVDDVLSGGSTVEEALDLQKQLKELLALGGFPIHKWSSNSREVLQNVPEAEREKPVEIQNASANEVIKTLGLLWDPSTDEFLFVVPDIDPAESKGTTKRYLLSQIVKLFDPYGFLSPVGVVAKLLIQRVWIRKFDWDDQLPEDLADIWVAYRDALPSIATLRKWCQAQPQQ